MQVRRFDEPDDTWSFGDAGRSEIVVVEGVTVVRSMLRRAGAGSRHQAQVEDLELSTPSPRVRRLDGSGTRASTGEMVEALGSYLDIEPGHLASVVGDEPCVLIDFDEQFPED